MTGLAKRDYPRGVTEGYVYDPIQPVFFQERQAMIKCKNVVAALRRDVSFIWHAVIVAVFIGFGGLALAATLLDLNSIRH